MSWLRCWHREKKGSKKQPRDVFLDLVFKRKDSSLFSHDAWMPFRFEYVVFCVNKSKKHCSVEAMWPMLWFYPPWRTHCVRDPRDQPRTARNCLSPASGPQFYFCVPGSTPTFFLPHLKGISIKPLVRRKRRAINIPQFLTAFPLVYVFQSILNQRDNKAKLFQISICLCSDGCRVWCLQFTVS